MITQERLKELFVYDESTGVFSYRVNSGSRGQKGKVAGSCTGGQRCVMSVDGDVYGRAILVFLWHTGVLLKPRSRIVHLNGDQFDDRIENLRVAGSREPLTAGRLRQVATYDPSTGVFTGKLGARKGERLGGPCESGDGRVYWYIGIDGDRYRASRLAWLYVTGRWPDAHVDHIDRDTLNDAFDNLREASNSENMRNALGWNNSSGAKGVYWNKKVKKWQSYITHYGKTQYLGVFGAFEDAVDARLRAAERLHGDFARHE